MEPVDLADVARRPQRYWNVDGLPELVMGLLWIVWGAAWLIGEALPRGGPFRLYWLLMPAVLVLGGSAAVWAIKRLKARLTFPRTGFVEWREPSLRERLAAAAIALVTAMVLAGAVVQRGPAADRAAPILGVILALSFVVVSMRQRAPHYLALSAVALATGLALGALQGGWTSVNWMFMIMGVASAGAGAIRLAFFLRRHPLTEAAS
jgi:hypothetical protein